MSNETTPFKKDEPILPTATTNNRSENHKKAAMHLEEAAKHHHSAAKHHEEGNHEKANDCAIKAHGHVAHAKDAQIADAKNHALKG